MLFKFESMKQYLRWILNLAFLLYSKTDRKGFNLLPPKPKFTFRNLKKGIQEFHRNFVLTPADKAAYNVVVV